MVVLEPEKFDKKFQSGHIDGTTMNKKSEVKSGKKKNHPAPTARDNTKLKCLRCGWDWEPRKVGALPKRCPGCSSPQWQMPAKQQNECLQCNYIWTSHKKDGNSARCPSCGSTDWNIAPGQKPLPSIKPKNLK